MYEFKCATGNLVKGRWDRGGGITEQVEIKM